MKISIFECDKCKKRKEKNEIIEVDICLDKESATPGGPEGVWFRKDLCNTCIAVLLNSRRVSLEQSRTLAAVLGAL